MIARAKLQAQSLWWSVHIPDKAEDIGAAGEIGIAWAPAPVLGEGLMTEQDCPSRARSEC